MSETVSVFGDINLDVFVKAKENMKFGGDVEGFIKLLPGGAGLNIATWVKRAEPTTNVILIGSVGDDFIADYILNYARSEGLRLIVSRVNQKPTGKTLIFVDKTGERSMLSFKGANSFISIDSSDEKHIYHSKIVHASAYTLLDNTQKTVSMQVINEAHSKGIITSLNLVAYNRMANKKQQRDIFTVLKKVNMLFTNLEEGKKLTNKNEPSEIIKWVIKKYGDVAIVTLGRNGCIAGNKNEIFSANSKNVSVVDTTGAGDAFVGTFLAKYSKGLTFKECIIEAINASTHAIKTFGAIPERYGPE